MQLQLKFVLREIFWCSFLKENWLFDFLGLQKCYFFISNQYCFLLILQFLLIYQYCMYSSVVCSSKFSKSANFRKEIFLEILNNANDNSDFLPQSQISPSVTWPNLNCCQNNQWNILVLSKKHKSFRLNKPFRRSKASPHLTCPSLNQSLKWRT